jgi:uncharacterized protein
MPNPICHVEIGCRDQAKTREFFSQLFDWKMEESGPGTMIRTGEDVGGHITALGHEPHNYTIFYVKVDDVKAHLEKAVSLGGKMLVPSVAIPGGIFAWFADPEGNTVGLYQDKK